MVPSLCLCVLLLHSVNSQSGPLGLYSDQDQVTILDDTTYHTTLEGRPHAWLVEFYASWCGYCQNLAPTFKALAKEMAGWRDVLKVAVIDCGDTKNNQAVCKHAEIKGFPTLKYFPANKTKEELGVNRPNEHHDQGEMKRDTIDFIQDMIRTLQDEDDFAMWPNLHQINLDSSSLGFSDLWPEDNNDTFVVVETEQSYIGKEVILNTWRRHDPHPVVERFTVSEGKEREDAEGEDEEGLPAVLARLGVTGLPALLVLSSHNQSVLALRPETRDAPGIVKAIREHAAVRGSANSRESTLPPPTLTTTEGRVEDRQEEIVRRRYSVYLSDLEKTVVFALENEVAVKEQIDTAALRQLISVLLRYFPPESQLLPHLTLLQAEVSPHTASSITAADLPSLSLLASLPSKDWVGCRGSSPQYGGFPCGLWQLWHTLAQAHSDEADPGLVLRAMVAYVREFFSCRECAVHFLNMTSNGTAIQEQVTSCSDAILFLWAAHNAVNNRLSSSDSVSSDPAFPKLRFPSPSFCPECWAEDETPGEEAVLAFLSGLYSGEAILSRTRVPQTDFDTANSVVCWGLGPAVAVLAHILIL